MRVTNRICSEALVAGPGVPLIYEFMKTQYKNLPRPLETEQKLKPEEMTSKHIIKNALQ